MSDEAHTLISEALRREDTVEERLDRIEKKIDAIAEIVLATTKKAETVIEEIKPTLDKLMDNSLVKMMIGKTK